MHGNAGLVRTACSQDPRAFGSSLTSHPGALGMVAATSHASNAGGNAMANNAGLAVAYAVDAEVADAPAGYADIITALAPHAGRFVASAVHALLKLGSAEHTDTVLASADHTDTRVATRGEHFAAYGEAEGCLAEHARAIVASAVHTGY